ncbi:NAD(P)-dependent oxidoreductase [Bacillus dakarensis]|uniref:NAD(P)-dependent oxidoreductase n=1 Tax=Robertmurraya dakarensis TaxID=1926278 RepID=UPI000981DD0C|nr:NAD(P)-dependent oxidoreductase [Bacillus dakarensis]
MQPFIINLSGKKVVIAGGGKIAARKARVLSQEHAEIKLIAPDFSDEVRKLSEEKGLFLVERKVELADFEGAFLVILATNDRDTNRILAQTLPPNQLVCVVDEATEGNVIFPASLRRGHLHLAVSAIGASPKLTRKLKKDLESQFDQSWDTYTEFLSECRKIIKKLPLSYEEKNKWLEKLLHDHYRMDEEARNMELEELSRIDRDGNKL